MNFCPNCGAKLPRPGEDQFCMNCGAKIPVIVPEADAAPVFSGVPVPPLPAQEAPAPQPAPPKGEDILNLIEEAQATSPAVATLWGEAELSAGAAGGDLFAEAETEAPPAPGTDLFAAAQPPPAQPELFGTAVMQDVQPPPAQGGGYSAGPARPAPKPAGPAPRPEKETPKPAGEAAKPATVFQPKEEPAVFSLAASPREELPDPAPPPAAPPAPLREDLSVQAPPPPAGKPSVQEIFKATQRDAPALPQENPQPQALFTTAEVPPPGEKRVLRQHSAPAGRRPPEPPPPRPPAGPRLMREAAGEEVDATRHNVPSPPPTPLPPQEEFVKKRSVAGRILTGAAILLVFLVVCAATILVMLYFQNRPAQTIEAFTEAIAGENYEQLNELTRMSVNGAAPANAQWQAFCAAFDEDALKELQSQLNKMAEGDNDGPHPYPAVTIKSRPFILFIERYAIEMQAVRVLAPGAADGSTLMLGEMAYPATPQEGGQLFEGVMPGLYQYRLVPPGIEPQNVPPQEISLFGAADGGPSVLDAGVPSVAVTISNCASDDAILYVNDNPVPEMPLGGVVTIPNVAVGSTIRISAIKDGVTMEASVVFADLNSTQLAFAEYTSQGEPSPPPDASDASAPAEGSITATNANTLLGAFYQSYLSCINSQSIDGMQGATEAGKTAFASRISSANNAPNLFEFGGVSCDEESIQVVSEGTVHLNARFDYTYKPRDTEEAYIPASNTQSVELVLQDGQWLVNKMVFVSDGDYNNHVIAAFPA